jgi:hypothetical protein
MLPITPRDCHRAIGDLPLMTPKRPKRKKEKNKKNTEKRNTPP